MPYIPNRHDFAAVRSAIASSPPRTAGELNYLLTEICIAYLRTTANRYQHMNDVLGALSGAALEFYRRKVAPYEDRAADTNGDLYD